MKFLTLFAEDSLATNKSRFSFLLIYFTVSPKGFSVLRKSQNFHKDHVTIAGFPYKVWLEWVDVSNECSFWIFDKTLQNVHTVSLYEMSLFHRFYCIAILVILTNILIFCVISNKLKRFSCGNMGNIIKFMQKLHSGQ